ncbi:MAG: DUF4145 domain-containing protein [Phycisphaerae bacterium]|nr:DUF4145 domain-containing protein [Phycisphaerae bacterium]
MQPSASFSKDRDEIVQKFERLLESIQPAASDSSGGPRTREDVIAYFGVRCSALNLIARTAGENSIYFRQLQAMEATDRIFPDVLFAVVQAAMTDFREGFMADQKLLASAEVFADFLVQAEVLLEHDYKDAAAVIIRAVLEDGLRRICVSKGIPVKLRDGVNDLAQALTKASMLTAVQKREIDAKREIGNAAAHGRFSEYTKQDVLAFHESVQRLLATLI